MTTTNYTVVSDGMTMKSSCDTGYFVSSDRKKYYE